jgi:membrane-bound lytic murein transglycosylase A
MNTPQHPLVASSLRWAAAAALASLAGCAAPPPAATSTTNSTAAATPADAPTARSSPPAGASVAGQARTFSTQLATYTSVSFDAVPGWSRDDFSESWPAFLGSCKVLTGRGAEWKDVCARALRVDGKSTNAIRGFFESEFSAYQIRDDDRRPDGVVTGYFEPEIAGSRTYAAPFIYPVYGQPEDMLFADARKLPAGNGTVAARVEGRNVLVQAGLSTRDMGAPGLYVLDLSGIARDTLDRKVRLRVEGKRLLPYYTREEIETKGAPNARVLAFVSSATALYEMQIQGSGRIKLPSGEIVRVAYAEQNGQPFRPTLAQASNGKPRSPVKVRGSSIELQLDDGDDDDIGAVGAACGGGGGCGRQRRHPHARLHARAARGQRAGGRAGAARGGRRGGLGHQGPELRVLQGGRPRPWAGRWARSACRCRRGARSRWTRAARRWATRCSCRRARPAAARRCSA